MLRWLIWLEWEKNSKVNKKIAKIIRGWGEWVRGEKSRVEK